jgi:hypothetical protein
MMGDFLVWALILDPSLHHSPGLISSYSAGEDKSIW